MSFTIPMRVHMRKGVAVDNRGTSTTVIAAICVIFCFTVGAVVAIAILAPDGDRTAGYVASLMGAIAPTLGVFVVLGRVNTVESKVDDANRALNGEMDAKIQRNVSETLEKHGVPAVPEPRVGD